MSKSEIKNRKMLHSQKNYEVYNFSIRKIEWLAVILRSYRYFYIHSKITNKCFDNIRIITIFAW